MKKKGFTLIELLAVIVILALVLTITIPTIINAMENLKRDSFASTAKLMISSAKDKVSKDATIKLPPNNYDATIITLSYLKLENVTKDVDGGFYSKINSYVLITKLNNKIVYYVTLQGSKRSIDLTKEGTIDTTKVVAGTDVTLPRLIGSTYTSTELGEAETFTVTVKYSY